MLNGGVVSMRRDRGAVSAAPVIAANVVDADDVAGT